MKSEIGAARDDGPRRSTMVDRKKRKAGGRRSSRVVRLDQLAPRDEEGHLRAIVETPKGSAFKVAFDPAAGAFKFKRALPAGVVYPFDFGFVPGTKADDGDPLDVLILHDTPTHPGILMNVRPVGAIGVEEDGEDGERIRNDRLLVVPLEDPTAEAANDGDALTARRKREIENFFTSVTAFLGKNVEIVGWLGRTQARKLVDNCTARRKPGRPSR